MKEQGVGQRSTVPLEGASRRTPPLWFRRVTGWIGVPVFLALLALGLLTAMPSSWSYRPSGVQRILGLLAAVLGPIAASFLLATRFLSGGDVHWLFLGMGALAFGMTSLVEAASLMADPVDLGIAVHGIGAALCGVISLLAVPLVGRPPPKHSDRRSGPALFIGYSGVLILVRLLAWATLNGRLPPFYVPETGFTAARQAVLVTAVLSLAAGGLLLNLVSIRWHPYALRWYSLGLGLLAVGIWGQASADDLWGLLAWASRGVLGLGVFYLLVGAVLALREPHAGARVPLSALLQSEREFRAFFENAGVGTAQIGPDKRFIRVNDRFCEITGYSRKELLKTTPFALDHPDDRDEDVERLRRLFDDPTYQYNAEKRYVRKDGCVIWVHVTISLVKDAEGKPLHTAAIIEDITERVQEERRASRYTRVVAGINRILSEVVRDETEKQAAEACINVAMEVTGSEIGIVGRLNTGGQLHDVVIRRSTLESEAMLTQAVDDVGANTRNVLGRFVRVLRSGKSMMSNDLVTADDVRAFPAGYPDMRSLLGVPLMQWGSAVGVLIVGKREDGYTEEQQRDLEELAPAVVQALAKKRAEEALRAHTDELEMLDRTNRMLLREIDHRVKNNLSAILGLVHAEERRLRGSVGVTGEAVLDDLAERVRNLATAHSLLSAGGWRPLQLGELVEEVIRAAASVAGAERRLVLQVSPLPVYVSPTQAHHLALVVGELAMNTAKYGCRAGCMEIGVEVAVENDRVRMVYRDSGPGYPAGVLAGDVRSVGLELLDSIVRMSLRGAWRVWNDEGAVTEIVFPVATGQKGEDDDEP